MKVLLVGSSGVGKSSLMLRFAADMFSEELSTTIGIDFRTKRVRFDEPPAEGVPTTVQVQIWDTAGQERFRTLTSSYYRGAHAVIFVHDVATASTRDDVEFWMDEAARHCAGREVVRMLISNKTDLMADTPQALKEELEIASQLARQHKMLHFACSAKTSEGVASAFQEVALRAAEQPSFAQACAKAAADHGAHSFVVQAGTAVRGGCGSC